MTTKVINDQTVIQFNLKWFAGTILSIVGILMTFYTIIFKPDIDELTNTIRTQGELLRNIELQLATERAIRNRTTEEITFSDLDPN